MHIAAERGSVEVVRFLCGAGAEVGRADALGSTALHLAARHGSGDKVVLALIDCGADLGSSDVNGSTPLHEAGRHGCASLVRSLCAAGAEVDRVDMDGFTALHMSIFNEEEAVAALLEFGADPNHRVVLEGHTPLHIIASIGGCPDFVRLLCGAGAEVDITCTKGLTALHLAARHNSGGEVVSALVDCGADLASSGPNGTTPLHQAGRYGYARLVQLLCAAGAEIDRADDEGRTALHMSMYDFDTVAAAEALLDFGADVNRSFGSAKRTALHLASLLGHPNLIRLLCGAGAKVNSRAAGNETPLMLAAGSGGYRRGPVRARGRCDHSHGGAWCNGSARCGQTG